MINLLDGRFAIRDDGGVQVVQFFSDSLLLKRPTYSRAPKTELFGAPISDNLNDPTWDTKLDCFIL